MPARLRASLTLPGSTSTPCPALNSSGRSRDLGTWLDSGRFDDVVPPGNADLLAEAAGLRDTHHVRLAADHYTGVLYLPVVLARITAEILDP